jgi:hypothetical protein
VQNVRIEADGTHNLEYGAAKEGKTLAVVEAAVHRIALEIKLVIEEVIFYPIPLGAPYSAELSAPRERNVYFTLEKE